MTKFCPNCEKYCETKTKTVEETFRVRNTTVKVSISRELCIICGECVGSDETDQQILDKILDIVNLKYRKKLK